jgi:hypothetical protein
MLILSHTRILITSPIPLIIHKNCLFSVRTNKPNRPVQMTEQEVRGLCLKSREIFLQQPILLELEAPLKICGMRKESQLR